MYPSNIVNSLQVGDFLNIDFNSALVQVVEKTGCSATIRVISGGLIGSNKAITVNRDIQLPALTDKDRYAIDISGKKDIQHFALSFASSSLDVELVRKLAGKDAVIISKIESRRGLSNFLEICATSDALLIDRGDLSREVPLEHVPIAQKMIIRKSRELGKKVYVATNLLESMVLNPSPTRAEVNDIYNTLLDGASGLVLAAETAIGQHPVGCVRMISRLISEFQNSQNNNLGDKFSIALRSQLVEPHGGTLVQRLQNTENYEAIDQLKVISVQDRLLSDCQLIGTGVYSPLVGFMDEATLESVLEDYRLTDDLIWPMPIVLPVSETIARSVAVGQRVVLASLKREKYAIMDLTGVFQIDVDAVSKK